MVWTGFSYDGKCNLMVFKSNVKAVDYQVALETHFLPFKNHFYQTILALQCDNSSVDTANSTREWVHNHNIQVLDWPANSPDLNPMETFWGILVRRICANEKRFNSKAELIMAIKSAWVALSQETLHGLITGMPERIFKIINHNGGYTK